MRIAYAGMSKEGRAAGCQDLAAQLVGFDHGDGLDVVLGGGRKHFLPGSEEGVRLDGQNLIDRWRNTHKDGTYVDNAAQFRTLNPANTQRLLGLFTPSHRTARKKKNRHWPK